MFGDRYVVAIFLEDVVNGLPAIAIHPGAVHQTYDAIVWSKEPAAIGERVSVKAENLTDARQRLKAMYGEDKVYYITNAEDASKRTFLRLPYWLTMRTCTD